MGLVLIFAKKPSQAKAYTVKSRHKTHIELAQSQLFPHGAMITWGIGHLVELKEPKAYDGRLVAYQFYPSAMNFKLRKENTVSSREKIDAFGKYDY